MDISSFELAEFLNGLPKGGLLELSLGDDSVWVDTDDAEFEAVGESNLKVTGRTGYGQISMANRSTMLIDIEEIEYLRNAPASSS